MLWYSLEAPHRGASNEYHNICFMETESEKKILDIPSYLELWKYKIYYNKCCMIELNIIKGDTKMFK